MPASVAIQGAAGVTDVPRMAEAPQYPEMVRHVLERMGWAGRRFDLYRARIEYPLLHGSVELSVRQRGRR